MNRATSIAIRLPLLAAIFIGTAAQAQTETGSGTDLTILAGYGFGGDFVTESDLVIDLDGGKDLGLILDFEYDDQTQWEVLYLQQDTSADTSNLTTSRASIDTDIRYLQGGGTYRGNGERVRPYIAGTVGFTHIEPHGENTESDTFWSLSIGGGVQIAASERVSFRLEARAFATIINSRSEIFCGSNVAGGQCLFRLQGDFLWQTHAFAGITFRF